MYSNSGGSLVVDRNLGVAAQAAQQGNGTISAGLENCVELVKNRLNMYWTVSQDASGQQVADIVLEGKLPNAMTDSYYLSYGYSAAGSSGSTMTGGTAIVGGLVNGECFGYDYFLDGEIQCDYAGGFGSCPTFVANGNANGKTDVELVACENQGGVLAVRMRKPLGVDAEGIPGTAWPLDTSKYAMYAMGGVASSSNAQQPDILLHTIETPRRPGLKVALGESQNTCPGSLGIVNIAGAPVAAAVPPAVDQVVVEQPQQPTVPAAVGGNGGGVSSYGDDDHGEAGHDDHGEAGHDTNTNDQGAAFSGSAVAAGQGSSVLVPLKCVMNINGEDVNFQACTTVPSGKNFYIAWNLTMDPNDPSVTLMTMGMNATLGSEYVAVGFPSKKNSMKNAATMIMVNSNIGSWMKQYYMSGYGESDVYPSSEGATILETTPPMNGPDSNGIMASMFTMSLPYSFASVKQGNRRRLFQSATSPLAAYNLIFAAGDVRSDGTLKKHYSDAAGNVDLASAFVSNGFSIDGGVTITQNEGAKVAHQVLMAIGWGVLIPLGIIGGRAKNQLADPKWFKVHRMVQSLGYLIGLIGFGLGFAITSSWETSYTVHRDLGITITVLATLQVLALAWRPKPGTTLRKFWGPYHVWVGRITALLAIANIYYGMLGLGEENVETWAWALYTAVLALIVLLGIFSEYREYKLRSLEAGKTESVMEQGKMQFLTTNSAKIPPSSKASEDGSDRN
jgi:hypothetical protein